MEKLKEGSRFLYVGNATQILVLRIKTPLTVVREIDLPFLSINHNLFYHPGVDFLILATSCKPVLRYACVD
jgi:hypothetical protein